MTEDQNSWSKEAIGGFTTFLTVMYIVFVNPMILSTEGTGLSFSGVMTATIILCFTMTLFMGLYAKVPFAVAPGMGINAFFTYNLILGKGIAWPLALGAVFWSGVLFLILSLSSVREKIAESIPLHLRVGASAGIGLFLTFIGLKNAGMIKADPVTLVKAAPFSSTVALTLVGLFIATIGLRRKNPFAFILSIFVTTILGALLGLVKMPEKIFSSPDFSSTFFKLDIVNSFSLALAPAIFALCFTDLFDSITTLVGVSHAGKILDSKGQPKNLRKGLIVDAWATLLAGVFGSSSGTAFIESSAGISAGAKTGRASVVTAFCFLPLLFLAPLAAVIPPFATAPILILVGASMFRSLENAFAGAWEDVVPGFLTLVLIPLTFSITQGILWGFISHVILYCFVGRMRELRPTLWIVSLISAVLLYIENKH
jgi:adenine/guanine/hypoxanthine permease